MPRRSPAVRQQLRVLRQPSDPRPLLQMLPRSPPQGGARLLGQDRRREIPPFSSLNRQVIVLHLRDLDGIACCGGGGRVTGGCGGGGDRTADSAAGEQMRRVQEEGGSHRVPVPVRVHLLRDPPVPGAALVHVRLQVRRQGGHRTCQPRGQGRKARQDLMTWR